MKNEEERMKEYLKDNTNANSDLIKSSGVDKVTKGIRVSLKTFFIIATIATILMLLVIAGFVYSKTYLVFSMNKKQFIKKLEKDYGQKIEIIEDNSTRKGNGTLVLRTKKEPIIEFHAEKDVYDTYKTDYEDRVFLNYIENSNNPLFENITVETKMVDSLKYENFQFLQCTNMYLEIENYSQIEEASRQLYQMQRYMEKELNTYKKLAHIKINEYISSIGYDIIKSEENGVFQEKYQYYWYLRDNYKDTSIVPQEDLKQINYPKTIDVYVNGEKLKNKEATEFQQIQVEINGEANKQIQYVTAEFDMQEREYEVYSSYIILNCDKFKFLSGIKAGEFEFEYKGEKYGVHYRDKKLRGNRLPYRAKISYFEELLNIQIEYDYNNKKVYFTL